MKHCTVKLAFQIKMVATEHQQQCDQVVDQFKKSLVFLTGVGVPVILHETEVKHMTMTTDNSSVTQKQDILTIEHKAALMSCRCSRVAAAKFPIIGSCSEECHHLI